jgi:hypothetical protein
VNEEPAQTEDPARRIQKIAASGVVSVCHLFQIAKGAEPARMGALLEFLTKLRISYWLNRTSRPAVCIAVRWEFDNSKIVL